MENDLSVIRISWAGSLFLDHTTLARRIQTIPQGWLGMILIETVTLCVAEAGSTTGPARGQTAAAWRPPDTRPSRDPSEGRRI